ncbi:MAG: hypothetical protein PUB97_00860 [Ruminococcus sp.]|nr:hypothetical protein [Ruminococcus sp.]
MKKVIKKIAAVAMAFTLLGTGTAITNSASTKLPSTSITASAAHNCRERVRITNSLTFTGLYRYDSTSSGNVRYKLYAVTECTYCIRCGRQVSVRTWMEWRRG